MIHEDVLEPDLPIIDAHHHLWDRARFGRKFDPGADPLGSLPDRYLLDELLTDMSGGHRVSHTVFVDCGAMYRRTGPEAMRPVGEIEFVNGIAAMSASGRYGETQVCAGIVGRVDFTAVGSRATEVLEAHIQAGGGRFRGIRQVGAYDADPDVLGAWPLLPAGVYRSERFREGYATLGPLGLSFDAWLLEPQLADVIDLARAFPETPLVLDHVGTPVGVASYRGTQAERFAPWRQSMSELAKSPNVTVKLGGLAMIYTGLAPMSEAAQATSQHHASVWKPYIETCIDLFGVDRCMFESNFPVDGEGCSYTTLWNAFKRLTADYSASEKAALYSGTAANFYRLEPTGHPASGW